MVFSQTRSTFDQSIREKERSRLFLRFVLQNEPNEP